MKNANNKLTTGESLTLLIIGFGNMFLGTLVFMKVWNWFPSEILGVIKIGYVEALALIIFLGFFKNRNVDTKKSNEQNFSEKVSNAIILTLAYLMIWGLAAIVNLFL